MARYWSLLDKFSATTLRGLDWPGLEPPERLAIRLYFRLSEDEADLRSQGWVSDPPPSGQSECEGESASSILVTRST